MRYREYLCPVTGLRVDCEIVREGDEALHDIVLSAPADRKPDGLEVRMALNSCRRGAMG